jgi:hypothetical protein
MKPRDRELAVRLEAGLLTFDRESIPFQEYAMLPHVMF